MSVDSVRLITSFSAGDSTFKTPAPTEPMDKRGSFSSTLGTVAYTWRCFKWTPPLYMSLHIDAGGSGELFESFGLI